MDQPPRRRRVTTETTSSSGSMWPTVALGLGVVVAGFGIGALISAYESSKNGAHPAGVPTAVAVVTPVAPSVPPATPVPHATARAATPSPSPAARAEPSPSPSVEPSPSPSPRRTASPSPSPSRAASPSARPTGTPTPRATATPTAKPAATPTARPTVAPTATPARATATPATSGATAVVQRYLDALQRGDEPVAYGALGGAAGDNGLSLKEEAFVDRAARITSIRQTGSDAKGTTIEVEIASSKGTYYATYHVTQGANGPYIDSHDYIKV